MTKGYKLKIENEIGTEKNTKSEAEPVGIKSRLGPVKPENCFSRYDGKHRDDCNRPRKSLIGKHVDYDGKLAKNNYENYYENYINDFVQPKRIKQEYAVDYHHRDNDYHRKNDDLDRKNRDLHDNPHWSDKNYDKNYNDHYFDRNSNRNYHHHFDENNNFYKSDRNFSYQNYDYQNHDLPKRSIFNPNATKTYHSSSRETSTDSYVLPSPRKIVVHASKKLK